MVAKKAKKAKRARRPVVLGKSQSAGPDPAQNVYARNLARLFGVEEGRVSVQYRYGAGLGLTFHVYVDGEDLSPSQAETTADYFNSRREAPRPR